MVRVLLVAVVTAVVAFAAPATVLASPPSNDNFANATVITSLPFTDTGDLAGTTTEPGEPQFCSTIAQTVWYTFTPTSSVTVRTDLSDLLLSELR
jgi:hypothetical protein